MFIVFFAVNESYTLTSYAPAYQRFGSQISNIHFIGPNKPWKQLPLRPAGTSSAVSPPTSPPPQEFGPPSSFGYHALLDRWFAVYDRHYRPSPTISENDLGSNDESLLTLTPSVPRYSSVWNSQVPSNAAADTSGIGGPLGLEELRNMAISGVGESATGSGEGTYRSLPLEGRIDLMRPPQPQPASEERSSPVVKIIVPEGPQTPVRSFTPMTTLPTPGPNELPPAPMFRGHSLPPETPTHARPGIGDMSYVTPDHNHLLPQAQPSPQSSCASSSGSPKYLSTPPRHSSPPLVAWNPAVSLRYSRAPPRHSSPPLVAWNPAVEAPPSAPPPASHFPADTYFPNVWDAQSHEHPAPEDNGGLFPVPPTPSIPETLVQEGHYQAVIGEPTPKESLPQPNHEDQPQQLQPSEQSPPEAQPSEELPKYHPPPHPRPDRSKITAVFPWEEKPRQAPVRFFPPTDSPPPGDPFIQPRTPVLKLNLRESSAHVTPSLSLPSQQGFPRTTTYANAWDIVPSIQRYASRLVRPSQPATASWTPEAGTAKKGGGVASGVDEYRSWQDMEEVSSRDADDEDEDDDEDGPSLVGREGRTETRGGRLQKRYHAKAVQTIPKQTKNQSVQVNHSPSRKQVMWSVPDGAGKRVQEDVNRDSSADDQATGSPAYPPLFRDYSAGVIQRGTAHPTTLDVKVSDLSNVPELSPPNARPSTTYTEISNAGREVTSPLSSMGPSSPPEGVPVSSLTQPNAAPTIHPVGRTFDPARDVDVFKKGSEEVLARFLKISSWEDDGAAGTGSPSVA